MVTKLPVAEEDHLRPRANPIAAERGPMTGPKEVMVVSLRAKRKAIRPKEKVVIRTGRTLMTGTKAVLVVVKRKALNQEVLLIQDAQPMTISQSGAMAANRQVKNVRILKKLPIQAGQVLMNVLKEASIAIHPARKEILNQEGRHIQADQHPMTGPEEILTANHQAKKEILNPGAHRIRAVRVLMISRKEVLAPIVIGAADLKNAATIPLSVNRKIHLTINQNQSAAPKNG